MGAPSLPVRSFWRPVPGFWRLLLISPMVQISYRTDAIVRVLQIVSRVFLFYVLWSAVYRPGQVSGGLDVRQAIAYSTLAALLVADRSFPEQTFAERIRDGTIVYLFLRPVSPVIYYWGVLLGGVAFRALLLVGGAAIGVAVGIVPLPATPAVLGAVVLSVLLSEVIYGCFVLYVELASFWTLDVHGIRFMYFFAVQLLSGALVPIWFFPDWAVNVLAWTPFAAAASTPVSLYIGRIPADAAVPALLLQAGWLVVLLGLAELLWQRARDRVVVQGG